MPGAKKPSGDETLASALRQLVARPDFDSLCQRVGATSSKRLLEVLAGMANALESPLLDGLPAAKPGREKTIKGTGHLKVILHTDGASKGNPGPAGAGAWWADGEGNDLGELAEPLGIATNNVAEWKALLLALEKMADLKPKELLIQADSELMIRQLKGDYRVKDAKLIPIHEEVMELLENFPRWTARHVRREHNSRADELANIGVMKAGR